jgi:signal transduction histidine kinase/ligand-binding sensor domain-containing protein/DNA-binding response OmpR family regulator
MSRFILSFSIFIFILLQVTQAQKDQLEFELVSSSKGFPESMIYSIIQDKEGFLWFGVSMGLIRYDGYEFKTFSHDYNNDKSLPCQVVSSLLEAENGIIWIGTFNGELSRYDKIKDEFTNYIVDSSIVSVDDNEIRALYEDTDSNIWLGVLGAGLLKFDTKNKTFKQILFEPPDSLSNGITTINAIKKYEKDILYLASNNGLIIYDHKNDKILRSFQPSEQKESISNKLVNDICIDRNKRIWVSTFGGLDEFMPDNEYFKHYKSDKSDPYSISYNRTTKIIEDHNGMIWIGNFGISKFDPTTEKFYNYEASYNDESNIWGYWPMTIFEDRSGVIWVGTNIGGLNKLNNTVKRFFHYTFSSIEGEGLSSTWVSAIHADKDEVLIGTLEGGLNIYNRKSGKFTSLAIPGTGFEKRLRNWIRCIHKDSRGQYWLGTGDGLFMYNRESNSFSNDFTCDSCKYLSHIIISQITEGADGNLWIGTSLAGVIKYNINTEKIQRYYHGLENPNTQELYRINTLFLDKNDRLWIGTNEGGLYSFESEEEKFVCHNFDQGYTGPITISDIFEDSKNRLWIGCEEEGIYLYDRRTKIFKGFNRYYGLADNYVWKILEDDSGNLWISTNEGISKFNYEKEIIINYGWDDLNNIRFNKNSGCKDEEGRMYFGGNNGFNVFFPHQIFADSIPPQITLSKMHIHDYEAILGEVVKEKKIFLKYYQNDLSFEFAALHFQNPNKNEYSFFLENYDDEWRRSGNQRIINYTNLDPGEYILRAKASNGDGIWNNDGFNLKINISKPPWKTWWAYVIYISIIIAIYYFIRKSELNKLRLKYELQLKESETQKLKELDKMKSDFFTNVSHEFRTPLTIILGVVEKLRKALNSKDIEKQTFTIRKSAQRLLYMINQILDFAKMESGQMQLFAVEADIVKFCKIIASSFQSLAEKKSISLIYKFPSHEINVYFDHDKLEKILSNLLSNALKFTKEDGEIIFEIKEITGDYVEIIVADTGIGISKDHLQNIFNRFYQGSYTGNPEYEGTGIGLALTKELVELHKGSVNVESELGKGSIFTVKLLLGISHLDIKEIASESETSYINYQKENNFESVEKQKNKNSSAAKIHDIPLILVIEDNSDLRSYISDNFNPSYKVIEANDGLEGYNIAIEKIPDLIISDIMMPKMTGLQLCENLKSNETTSHIPIILLTARTSARDIIHGLKTGADDYLTKPFNATELVTRVQNLITQRRQLQEKFSHNILYEPNKKQPQTLNEIFLQKVVESIEKNLSEIEYGVESCAADVHMSRVQLYRKLFAITGMSASSFIRSYRLKRSAELLVSGTFTIAEVAYKVGFNESSYFSKCFREEYHVSPSKYISENIK